MFDDEQLERLFRAWWTSSYPTPPGPHALMMGMGFGRHLLDELERQQQQQEGNK